MQHSPVVRCTSHIGGAETAQVHVRRKIGGLDLLMRTRMRETFLLTLAALALVAAIVALAIQLK